MKLRLALLFVSALALVLVAPQPTRAELVHDHAGWGMVFAQGSFEKASPDLSKLLWFMDLQARFFDATDGYGQSIVRPALGWAFTEELSAYLGYGWIRDSPAQGKDRDEHRIFQQLTWNHRFEPIDFQSRTRLEQRLVETGDDTGWRFRQLIKLTWPIPGLERLALAGYDEIFLNFNDTDWGAESGFDQNRLFLGPQWTFDSKGRVKGELGYLNRYTHKKNADDGMDHIVSVNLFLNF
jgi:hypothetical protein